MIRLFVALPLPESVRLRLSLLMGGIPGARWVPTENLHLTLRFIGEVDESAADDAAAALDEIRARPFRLTLGGIGEFGHGEKMRALWIGAEREPALVHLRDKVESALVRLGQPPEGRKFVPHVTLARLRQAPADRLAAFIQANQLLRVGPIAVERFVLYSSWRQGEAQLYRAEAEYALA